MELKLCSVQPLTVHFFQLIVPIVELKQTSNNDDTEYDNELIVPIVELKHWTRPLKTYSLNN